MIMKVYARVTSIYLALVMRKKVSETYRLIINQDKEFQKEVAALNQVHHHMLAALVTLTNLALMSPIAAGSLVVLNKMFKLRMEEYANAVSAKQLDVNDCIYDPSIILPSLVMYMYKSLYITGIAFLGRYLLVKRILLPYYLTTKALVYLLIRMPYIQLVTNERNLDLYLENVIEKGIVRKLIKTQEEEKLVAEAVQKVMKYLESLYHEAIEILPGLKGLNDSRFGPFIYKPLRFFRAFVKELPRFGLIQAEKVRAAQGVNDLLSLIDKDAVKLYAKMMRDELIRHILTKLGLIAASSIVMRLAFWKMGFKSLVVLVFLFTLADVYNKCTTLSKVKKFSLIRREGG